jgi:hypothetical protein
MTLKNNESELLVQVLMDLVQIAVVAEEVNFDRIAYWAERTASQTVGVAVSLRSSVARLNWPFANAMDQLDT